MGDPSEKLNFTLKVSHAKLRNVIERAFGVLKARSLILKNMPSDLLAVHATEGLRARVHKSLQDEDQATVTDILKQL
nr:hypothetical protein [Tanacetum cinerariifolium]